MRFIFPEEVARKKALRLKNLERDKAQAKIWREKNREKIREYQRKYFAKKQVDTVYENTQTNREK